jgi:TRAP-type C4-dicarboxylate transport system permease small subunit
MKMLGSVSRWVGYISAVAIILMMLLVTANVIGRYFIREPITGAPEIACLMMIVIVFPALAWVALEGKHIRVDFIMDRFPPLVQTITEGLMLIISLGIYAIISWRSFLAATRSSDVSSLLSIPQAPFYWIMAVGWALFTISIIALIIKNIAGVVKK